MCACRVGACVQRLCMRVHGGWSSGVCSKDDVCVQDCERLRWPHCAEPVAEGMAGIPNACNTTGLVRPHLWVLCAREKWTSAKHQQARACVCRPVTESLMVRTRIYLRTARNVRTCRVGACVQWLCMRVLERRGMRAEGQAEREC